MGFAYIRSVLGLTIFCLIFLPIVGTSQSKPTDEDKIKTAVERTKKATEILKQVAALPADKGIPKDIAEKMNLIGIVPDVFQLSLLFSKAVRGYGVSSIRQDNGWSMPSYYFFGQASGVDLTSVGSKHFDLVMVVVNADLKIKKGKDKTKPTADKKGKADKPQSYLYAFADGILKPLATKAGLVSALLGAQTNIVYDNKLNKAVYGAKGDDVVLGNIDLARQIPPEVTGFRDALNQLFPVKR